MPATVIAGLTGPIWGATDHTNIFVSSMEVTFAREKAELKNAKSEFVQALWHSPKKTLSVRGKVRNTSGLPAASMVGHLFTTTDTQFSGSYYIDEITQSKQEGDWMEFSANCTQYENPSTGNFTTTTD